MVFTNTTEVLLFVLSYVVMVYELVKQKMVLFLVEYNVYNKTMKLDSGVYTSLRFLVLYVFWHSSIDDELRSAFLRGN